MIPRQEPAIELHRRRERDGLPVDDRRLARAIASSEFVRVVPGSYARAADWSRLDPIDRHYVRTVEALDRAKGEVTIAMHAAAAVWGIETLGAWPARIDTLVPRTSGGRSTGLFRRHCVTDPDVEVVPWRGHLLTSPAQTAADLARVGSFTAGVVAVDQALWLRREGGALTTADAVRHRLDAGIRRRGGIRALRVAEFATGRSDSVGETRSRVLLRRLGFPEPELQRRFVLPSGRVAYVDFWWEELDHVGEYDGVGKYLDPALLGGRTPREALIEEKDRGDELRRVVRTLSRWRTPALTDPRRLYDILTGDGLPASRPRPPAGLVWP